MPTLIMGSPHITSTHPPTGETDQVPNHRRSRSLLRHRSVWQHDRHYSPQGDRPELRNLSRLSKLGGPAQRRALAVRLVLSTTTSLPSVKASVRRRRNSLSMAFERVRHASA